MATRSNWLWLGLLLTSVLWFSTLGTRSLLNPDEGRYAEIPREMLASGDWITPRLNGLKYFEKPALQYWMTALAYRALGQNEFAARFWSGLTGFAGILLAGFAAARLFGRAAGIMAAAITASSVLYLVIGHINTLDMSLSFFMQLSLCSFLLGQQAIPRSRSERNWMLLAWAGAGLGFMSKGLIALVLPALTLLLYTLCTREFSAWRRLHPIKGLSLFLLLTLPWLIAIARANPEFLQFFFLHEQFERFLLNHHDRDGPWWYFFPIFVLGSLPWIFIALRQFKQSWQLDAQQSLQAPFQTRRFLLLWLVVVLGFFSLSHSKLPPYILPMVPIFAMLLGDAFTRLAASTLRPHLLVMGSALALLALIVALVPADIAGSKSVEVVNNVRLETIAGLLIAAAGMLLSVRLIDAHGIEVVVLTTSFGMLLGLSLLVQSSNALAATRSGRDLALQIQSSIAADTPIYSVTDYDQTLPFYLKRCITLVDYRGELDFGLSQEPELAVDSIEAFVRIWQRQSAAVAIMPPALYTQLLHNGLPMQIIAQHPKQIAVRKGRPPS